MKNEKQDVIHVTAGIIRKGDSVLIAKRPSHGNGGKYEFPGGKLEPNETMEDCLKRELLEEFGIESQIGPFHSKSSFTCGNKEYCLHAYFVNEIIGEPKLLVHDEIKWVGYQDLMNFDFMPADMPIVVKLSNSSPVQKFKSSFI